MAKKELTREDILKKQYSNLVKINQRLKNISSGYYLAYDGTIYMNSLVSFVEKFIHLNDPECISEFLGTEVMPNAFFEFTKIAKKSKLTITETNKGFWFGQNDSDLTFELPIANSDKSVDTTYCKEVISPAMYKRMWTLENEEGYTKSKGQDFQELPKSCVEDLLSPNPVYIEITAGNKTLLTKHILLDLKKDDVLLIAKFGEIPIDKTSQRTFYMLKQITDIYTCYTLFNTLECRS